MVGLPCLVDDPAMLQSTPAVGTFLRRLAAHLVSRRVYVSLGEREAIVGAVGQFVPGYSYARLADDAAVLNPDLLRAALADLAAEGGTSATQALVATIQLGMADGHIDAADHQIVYWVGDAVGFPRERVDAALKLATTMQVEPVGAAPTREWVD